MAPHFQLFKPLPLNFLDNLVHLHMLRAIGAHTNSFIHFLKRNKMAPARAEDLVYAHSNLRLLSRRNEEYINTATKMQDITGDFQNESDIHGGARILESAFLTLDEPELEAMVIGNASTSVLLVKVKFKVKLLILMMMMLVFDCLVDYLLFCFSFKLVSCILISEYHGMFQFQSCGLYLIYEHHVLVIIYYCS